MNAQEMIEFQQKLVDYQKSICETTFSQGKEIIVTFSGSLEIIKLEINLNLLQENNIQLLIETINDGFRKVSLKVNAGIKEISQQMMLSKP